MTAVMDGETPAKPKRTQRNREVIYRHRLPVRLTHWLNALCIFLLVGTGLNIFNAHPSLYWGQKGDEYDKPFLALYAIDTPAGPRGQTAIGPLHFDTTGVLGWSKQQGDFTQRGWPEWITLPSYTDLADARHWHFFFAWLLVLNGIAYLAWSLGSRHLQRDIWPTVSDLKAIPRSVLDHIRLKHPTGEEAKRYNVLQRLAYLGLIVAVCGMVLTGLSMSPGVDAVFPLFQLFGGRQSARSLHFIFAAAIVLFIAIHLIEVVLAGPLNEVWSIISGRYAVPQPHAKKGADQ
jgi:thiosulfate reductase cytochrome b subunit